MWSCHTTSFSLFAGTSPACIRPLGHSLIRAVPTANPKQLTDCSCRKRTLGYIDGAAHLRWALPTSDRRSGRRGDWRLLLQVQKLNWRVLCPALIIPCSSAPKLSNNIIQKGLVFARGWSGTVANSGRTNGAPRSCPAGLVAEVGLRSCGESRHQPNGGSRCPRKIARPRCDCLEFVACASPQRSRPRSDPAVRLPEPAAIPRAPPTATCSRRSALLWRFQCHASAATTSPRNWRSG
jgi:hypothetical protein